MTMWLTLKPALAHCTAGVSLSMLPWLMRGIVPCECPPTLMISPRPQCGITQALISRFARTYIYCRSQCETPAFTDCALNGGISRSLTGKNICRPRRRSRPHKCARPIGKTNYDRHVCFGICDTRNTSCVNQSIADPRFEEIPVSLVLLLSAAGERTVRVRKSVNPQDTSAETKPDLQLEIAHVLLIDVVGYSKLLVNEQIELLQELNQIVHGTQSFRAAEASGKLIRVPTGDGMALLFFRSPEEPVRCALETSKALQEQPHIQLRMGIHSGPVNPVKDVNDQTNMAGAGINYAQRVLDSGDAGHVLLSAHVAEDLAQYRHWQPYLQDLGECEVKHGLRLHLFNLYKDGLGNPEVPEKLKRRKWKYKSAVVRSVSPPRWPKLLLVVASIVLAVALISVSISIRRISPRSTQVPAEGSNAASIPEKSIAVLPFG